MFKRLMRSLHERVCTQLQCSGGKGGINNATSDKGYLYDYFYRQLIEYLDYPSPEYSQSLWFINIV